ncbi:Histidine acid phosphatase family protein [Trichomonas vaginalis G3]|uniref:Histidine acid phosphatase family protein n=1 Tax=Trichomonas vaginalis (strain ATCC PRA-98 / G3) TaxID=412133 RepID=A2DL67_TRIV3|nr:histidine acid phosphatase [Trichomonas vaginalis G3]EAY18858.1 Histidine acid phosphatase family protein [Trichomonas vaginalis G3]KAI5526028.1 acid phosphatase protein [Trichomonas vaginalis G3]|eukprot:XP_001579844.1 histidine acid phosphatase [Trichomonas vaginalis G3]
MFSFFVLSRSALYQCKSPLNHPPVVPNGTLKTMFLFTRHGLNSPEANIFPKKDDGFWLCDAHEARSPNMRVSTVNNTYRRYRQTIFHAQSPFPPNCGATQLLVEGMNDQHELGEYYRNYLVNELNLLSEFYEPSQVEFRSGQKAYSVKSAQAFIDALYPPEIPGEMVDIMVGTGKQDVIFNDPNNCNDIQKYFYSWIATTEFSERFNTTKEILAPLLNYIKIQMDEMLFYSLNEMMMSYYCSDNKLPSVVTDEVLDTLYNNTQYTLENLFNKNLFTAGPAWKEMFKHIDGQTEKKFFLYSSNMPTITSIIASITGVTYVPPYNSHLSIEVWTVNGKDYIRAVYNGEVLKNQLADGQELIEISKMKEGVSPLFKYCTTEIDVLSDIKYYNRVLL